MNFAARVEEIKNIFSKPIGLADFIFVNSSMVICPEEVTEILEGTLDESRFE